MNQRNQYFDFLRGIAIILVVGIHTYHIGENSIAIRQLLNTAVPIFVVISGFFLSQKHINTKTEYFTFLRKQLPKVYLPVLVWSVPLFFLGIFRGNNVLLQFALFFTCGYSIYYFVAFIIQCYISLPFLTHLESSCYRGGVIVSALISIAWVGLVVWFNMVKGMHLPMILYAGLLPCWIMFFVTGIALGQRPDRQYNIYIPVIIALVGLGLSILGSKYLYERYSTGVGIKPSAFIYSFGGVLLLFSAKVENIISKGGIIFKIVVFIGRLSFGIYLTHCYVLLFVSSLHVCPVKVPDGLYKV